MEHITTDQPFTSTIGSELDRLEVPAGKIGLNTKEQAFALLTGLDDVFNRLQELDPESQSRRQAEVQFESIVASLHKEAGRFIRDLGGLQAYRQAREKRRPGQDHSWWYLDEFLAEKRKSALRRIAITAGAVVVVLVILAVVYNRFLAPDPRTVAIYSSQQAAQDAMINGDTQQALQEVEKGLAVDAKNPDLLIQKGVILSVMGQKDQAEQAFTAAQQGLNSREDFLVGRGQAYLLAGQPKLALADTEEAIKLNPQSGQAYLLAGQVNEVLGNFQDAMDAYNKAYEAAGKANQPQLQALARTRLAMLLQSMNSQGFPTGETPTP